MMKSNFNDSLISVIVPVYNTEKYLHECIESVFNQTYENWELILVDDGSTDESGKICDEIALFDNRVKVFHKQNEGQLATRIYGIHKAKGTALVFLDSDDYLDEDALSILNNYFRTYNCDVIAYHYRIVDGINVVSEKKGIKLDFVKNRHDAVMKLLVKEGFNSMCCKAIKSNLVGKMDFSQFYHIRRGEDLLHSIEIYKNLNTALFIPDAIYNYRVNLASITHKNEIDENFSDFSRTEFLIEILKQEKIFTSENDWNLFRKTRISAFCYTLIRIANLDISVKYKIAFFKKIKNSNYYNNFLKIKCKGLPYKTNFLFTLFKRGYYRLLVNLILIHNKFLDRKKSTYK